MPETFRKSKIEKFIEKKADFMRNQQLVIEQCRKNGIPIDVLQFNQIATYNYTFDLCQEFGIEVPVILGLTPNVG